MYQRQIKWCAFKYNRHLHIVQEVAVAFPDEGAKKRFGGFFEKEGYPAPGQIWMGILEVCRVTDLFVI